MVSSLVVDARRSRARCIFSCFSSCFYQKCLCWGSTAANSTSDFTFLPPPAGCSSSSVSLQQLASKAFHFYFYFWLIVTTLKPALKGHLQQLNWISQQEPQERSEANMLTSLNSKWAALWSVHQWGVLVQIISLIYSWKKSWVFVFTPRYL